MAYDHPSVTGLCQTDTLSRYRCMAEKYFDTRVRKYVNSTIVVAMVWRLLGHVSESPAPPPQANLPLDIDVSGDD